MGKNEDLKKEAVRIEKMSDAKLGKFMIKKFLTVFILWLLKKKELCGYEIIKIMQAEGMHRATASNVYPILNMLSKKGYLKVKKKREGKREKKYYKTSAKGRAVLEAGRRWFVSGLKKRFFREMAR